MATVTGFTAARMQVIEDESIVGGIISAGGNLLLEQRNGTSVDAGQVRGPQGIQGPEGEVSTSSLNAAILADANAHGLGHVTGAAVATRQSNPGLQKNLWLEITGTSCTFTPIAGHHYQILMNATFMSLDSTAGTQFDLIVRQVTDNQEVIRVTTYAPYENRAAGVSGGLNLLCPTSWATGGARTFTLFMRTSSEWASYVESAAACPTRISIVDTGT